MLKGTPFLAYRHSCSSTTMPEEPYLVTREYAVFDLIVKTYARKHADIDLIVENDGLSPLYSIPTCLCK